MAANTSSLVTDFNVAPYFDDYNEEKNFHRVLFKPGLAVQTRELTQLQTILQNQIDRFGKHVFVEGSRVAGGEFNIDDNYHYVTVPDNYANGAIVDVNELLDVTFRGTESEVQGKVINAVEGNETETNKKTLYVNYTRTGANASVFTTGESIVSVDDSSLSIDILPELNSVGVGTNFKINEGIIFAKGHFIRFDEQEVIVDRYTSLPTAVVGFVLNEELIDSQQDETLLDNAAGSFNFSAPGSDRLKLSLELNRFNSFDDMTDVQKRSFIELLNIQSGFITTKKEKTQYNEIRDYVASRTKDFFGDVIINGMGLRLREHLNDGTNNGLYYLNQNGDNNLIAVGVDPGKAYVEGYDVELFDSLYVPIDKGIDFERVEQVPVSANYGNYIEVNELVGNWNPEEGAIVKLYDTVQGAISTGLYSNTVISGSEIGQARFKTLEHESGAQGSADCVYRVYLTDVKVTANTFADTRSIYIENASTADAIADVVLTNGIAQIKETNFNRSIFKIPSNAVRSIRDDNEEIDTTYTFTKDFDVSIGTSGLFTINTGDTTEIFLGSGLQNASEKNEKFVVALNEEAFSEVTGTITVSGVSVTGSNTAFTSEFNVGEKVFVNDTSEVRIIDAITDDTNMTVSSSASSASDSAFNKYFATGEILDLTVAGTSGSTRTVDITTSQTASFNVQETFTTTILASVYSILNKVDAREISKVVHKNNFVRLELGNHPANTAGPWNLGVCDAIRLNDVRVKYGNTFVSDSEGTSVLSQFKLDNGQRDNFYDQSRILLKSTGTVTLNSSAHILVDLDYFTHDYSQGSGYFSVDSYPIDDTNSAPLLTIQTEEIPIYVSPTNGVSYDLRNSIDARPSKMYTANVSNTVVGSTINPTLNSDYNVSSGGLRTPKANESFTIDYSYYLPRIDVLFLDKKGMFQTIKGVPSLNPEIPRQQSNGMKMATINVAPYPSLTSFRANEVNRPDYKCTLIAEKRKQYGSDDISNLEQRVSSLEYYTALSQLERQTIDQTIISESGIDRFKNGIFTDPFVSHRYADYTNEDYAISVDKAKRELRPKFEIEDVKLQFSSSTNLRSYLNDTFFVLDHEDEVIASQPYATSTKNISGFFYSFEGSMTLSPDSDYWVDIRRSPDLNVDFDLTNESWEQMEDSWNSNWSSWETLITGAPKISERIARTTKLNVSENSSNATTNRFGTSSSVQQRQREIYGVDANVQTKNVGERVLDISLTPYLRSTSIEVSVVGMKPNTLIFPFFDNEDVSEYCTQTDSLFNVTGIRGGDLLTDENGEIYLLFTIPNDNNKRFRVGERLFTLTDSVNNSDSAGSYTTKATGHFNGSSVQRTVHDTFVSTRAPIIKTRSQTDSRITSSTRLLGSSVNVSTTRTAPLSPKNVFQPSATPSYRSVKFTKVEPQWTVINTKFGNPGETLGEFIDKLSSNNEFNKNVSNTNVSSLMKSFSPEIEALQVAGVLSYNEAQAFRSDFFKITGQVLSSGKSRSCVEKGELEPVLQTFVINELEETSGVFITKAELYFATKDSTYGVEVHLKEIEQGTGLPTNRIIPNSIVTLTPSQISTSTDGTVATTVTFSAPVYLLNGTTYGIVIKPLGNNTSTSLWISRLGQIDLATGARVNEQPFIGALYASTNDDNYKPIQEEDIKLTLYRANFDVNTSAELITVNQDLDFILGKNLSGEFIVGESVTGGTSGSIAKVKESYVKDDQQYIVLADSTGAFSLTETLTGSQSSATIEIVSIYDIPLHVSHNEITSVVPSGATLTNAIQTTSNNNIVSSGYVNISNTRDNSFDSERKVLSRTNEINSLGEKSYKMRSLFLTTNEFVSPVIDLSRSFVAVVGNLVNADDSGEETKIGGTAQARYISSIITLSDGQDAEDLKVYIDEYRTPSSNVRVYAKVLNGDDTETFDDLAWFELAKESKEKFSSVENIDDFYEAEYGIPSSLLTGPIGQIQYTNIQNVEYTGYKHFAIKVVLLATNKSTPPRVRNLRAIALQI